MITKSGNFESKRSSPVLVTAVVLFAGIAAFAGLFGGPALGDHEAIVAECARQMRLSGDWLMPQFLETPFIRKPPLPYWLVAAASYPLPEAPNTGLPVTAAAARLPSALAAFGTVLLLWRLASSMFGRRTGIVTAVIAASSLFTLQFGLNATAEMLLVFGCTWAYLHFWYGINARSASRRFWHMMLFYVALGFAMLAKGPAPIAMTAMPLAFWWYTERPFRVLARRGPSAWRSIGSLFLRGLWPRTARAFTRLWLLPGLIVFLLLFVPWMWAVGRRFPEAWSMWNWQYVQRAQGDFEDTRVRTVLYYVPIFVGFVVPWLFLAFEGLVAPWLKRYARFHRPLLFAGLWAVIGVLVMSLMSFKKPYYIGPAVPGLMLLIGVVASRVFAPTRSLTAVEQSPSGIAGGTQRAWMVWGAGVLAAIGALAVGRAWFRRELPDVASVLTAITAGALVFFLVAGACYIQRKGWLALGLTAVTTVAAFQVAWYLSGPQLGSLEKVAALDHALDSLDVPLDGTVLWADQRPDARLSFYFCRRSRQMIAPGEIVSQMVDRTKGKTRLAQMALDRASELLSRTEPVYLIVERKHFQRWRTNLPPAHELGSVQCDPSANSKDWLIVSNIDARRASARQPAGCNSAHRPYTSPGSPSSGTAASYGSPFSAVAHRFHHGRERFHRSIVPRSTSDRPLFSPSRAAAQPATLPVSRSAVA